MENTSIIEKNAEVLEAFIEAECLYQIALERNGMDRSTIHAKAIARKAAKVAWRNIKATLRANNPARKPVALVSDLMEYVTKHANKTASVRIIVWSSAPF
jgi:hypothetical protein